MEFFMALGLVAGATKEIAGIGGLFLVTTFIGGLTVAVIKAAKEF